MSSIRTRLATFTATLVLLHLAIIAGGAFSIMRGKMLRERSYRSEGRLAALLVVDSLSRVELQQMARSEVLSQGGLTTLKEALDTLEGGLGAEAEEGGAQPHVQAQRARRAQLLAGWTTLRERLASVSAPSPQALQQARTLLVPLTEALEAERQEQRLVREQSRKNLVLAQLMALLVPSLAAVLLLLVVRSLMRPVLRGLDELRQGAERLRRGEQAVQVHFSGPIELVDLGEAFNTMARELATRTEEASRLAAAEAEKQSLQRHSAMLEETVRGRTAALEQSLEQLKRAQEQLQLADRLASVGQLAAGVAHEINNPLAYITSNLRFVIDELGMGRPQYAEERAELVQALKEALEGSSRVAHIVRDLKQFSRGDENESGPAFVEEVLRGALKMAAPTLRHRTRVVTEIVGAGWVRGSAARLGQVFLNLLLNAAQAMPSGRSLEQNAVTVRVYRRGDEVAVEVSDTGVGMSPQVRSRIFDPFFTTRPVGEGTGLGLAVCHGIITAVGGRIEVESEPGHGSTFRVVLKVADEPTEEIASSEVVMHLLPVRERRRVLVVDDEPHVRKALERMLGRHHDMCFADGGSEALAKLEGEPDIEVVLCDLMMPGMTGMELYTRVAQCFPGRERTFIFMTGGGFTVEARTFIEAVTNPVVDKPVDPGTLGPLVAAVPRWRVRASSEHVADVEVEPLASRLR